MFLLVCTNLMLSNFSAHLLFFFIRPKLINDLQSIYRE